MPNFEGLYYGLFAAIADAVEYLEQGQQKRALQRLISAMQEAEERYIDED